MGDYRPEDEVEITYSNNVYGSIQWLGNIATSLYAFDNRKQECIVMVDDHIDSREISIDKTKLKFNGVYIRSQSDSSRIQSANNTMNRLLPENCYVNNTNIQGLELKSAILRRRHQFDSNIFKSKCHNCGNTVLVTPRSREKDIVEVGKNNLYLWQ